MPASHGWTADAVSSYETDRAEATLQLRIRDFRERSTMIAASWSNDPKGYDVEYSRHCDANLDLAPHVSEIADHVVEKERSARVEDWHRRQDEQVPLPTDDEA